jgi:hypothetical protein
MCERRELVEKVVTMVEEVRSVFPLTDISYVTMFPKHVEECCGRHMTRDDVVVMDLIRREVDKDVVDSLREQEGTVMVLQWWDVLGPDNDMTRKTGVIAKDGVHLTEKANRNVAISLCSRI